jgi:hypothetical protein
MVDAAGIIGSGSPGDDGLSPVEHAEQLRTSAPKLAVLLTRSAPVELARYAEVSSPFSILLWSSRCRPPIDPRRHFPLTERLL